MTKIISVLLSLCIMYGCSKSPSKNLVNDRLGDTSVETGKGDTGNNGEVSASEGKDHVEQPPLNSNPQEVVPQGDSPQSSVFWNTNRPFWDNLWHWKVLHYWDWRHYGSAVAVTALAIYGIPIIHTLFTPMEKFHKQLDELKGDFNSNIKWEKKNYKVYRKAFKRYKKYPAFKRKEIYNDEEIKKQREKIDKLGEKFHKQDIKAVKLYKKATDDNKRPITSKIQHKKVNKQVAKLCEEFRNLNKQCEEYNILFSTYDGGAPAPDGGAVEVEDNFVMKMPSNEALFESLLRHINRNGFYLSTEVMKMTEAMKMEHDDYYYNTQAKVFGNLFKDGVKPKVYAREDFKCSTFPKDIRGYKEYCARLRHFDKLFKDGVDPLEYVRQNLNNPNLPPGYAREYMKYHRAKTLPEPLVSERGGPDGSPPHLNSNQFSSSPSSTSSSSSSSSPASSSSNSAGSTDVLTDE